MINYTITRVDVPTLSVQIMYSKEGYPNYMIRSYVGEPFNQEAILERVFAHDNILHVQNHWNSLDADNHPALDSEQTVGQVKEIIVEDKPDFQEGIEVLEKVLTEEEDCIRQSWSVRTLEAGEVASYIRQKRHALLLQTDMYALSDRTMSAEMTAYREALRNITDQEGFPFNVEWPIKPID